MERHPKCSVTTGRQRVMTKDMQGMPEESSLSVESWLRHAQRFDYESSFVCYTGTFSAVGFLPVVPGPCGLYRTDVLLPSKENGGYAGCPCDWYFDVVNTDPDKSGMVLGNLRIAEDRVLSYSVVLKARGPSEMGLVPQAVFYFEAETNLKSLILQRRRWINGTWAGYWYLAIQHPDLVFKCSQLNFLVKLFVWFLLLCQLATYFIVALSPAIFLGALRLALSNLAADTDGFLATVCWIILVLMYLYFVYYHHNNVYLGYLFNIWLLFSSVLSTASIASFIVYVVNNNHLLHYRNLMIGDFRNSYFTDSLTIYIVLTIFALPLIIAIIADGRKSIFLMLRSVIPYYLFLPMVVGFFAAYSFSRCWDLTWGNRPSEDDPAHRQAQNKMEQLRTQSATLAAFIAIANIFFFFAQELFLNEQGGKLYIAFAIFATTLIQMLIGLVWFTLWRIKVILFGVWYFLTHFHRQKKFIYKTYGDEEDDSSEEIDAHTLYYNDNNDSDDECEDFINDDDEAEDYYDADSRAIVLVDGPLQRHMSVTQFNLPSIPEITADGAATSSPSLGKFTIYEGAKPAKFVVPPLTIPTTTVSPASTSPPQRSPRGILTNSMNNNNNNNNNINRLPLPVPSPLRLSTSTEISQHVPSRTSSMNPIVARNTAANALVSANRPKLTRSTNSAMSGVTFAHPPAVVISSQHSQVRTLRGSRIRSSSLPPLPQNFFTTGTVPPSYSPTLSLSSSSAGSPSLSPATISPLSSPSPSITSRPSRK